MSGSRELTQLAGRTVMVGLAGPDLPPATARRLRNLGPAGVILFARNLDTPEGLVALGAALEAALPQPALIALDQEGGRVSRLEPWIGPTPPAATLAARGPSAVFRFGRLTGDALRALGFNLDFAPVVDLCPAALVDNAIGDRSFGTDPESAGVLAGAFLDGLGEAGVAGCVKHFPGLGGTTVDSHAELPVDHRDGAELERHDLLPFEMLGPRAPTVMVGHAWYPAFDPVGPTPATGSERLVTGVLRERLGYDGLVVTDDLEMGAVDDLDAGGGFAVQALRAGCDLLLYCHNVERAETAVARIADEAARDPALARRLTTAADRIERTARRWPAHTPTVGAWERARAAIADFVAANGA